MMKPNLSLGDYLKRYGGSNEWIEISGPSMEGKGIYSGDLVVASSGAPLAFGKLVAVRVGDRYPLVRLYTSRGLWLCYADRQVKEVLDEVEEAVITGVIIYHLRDLYKRDKPSRQPKSSTPYN